MSLKELASTMSAQGRGPDDVLVHMSSKELAGLQGLALAAGGSLTVNPKTGLPEAGFLDSILPTILGIGAMFIPGMQPLGAAAIGAGSKAVLDPNASFMDIALAGMGGYGGAQLGAGLSGVGASAAQAAAVPLAETAGQTAMQQLAQQSGAAIGQGMQQFGAEGLKSVGNLGLQATPAASSVAAPMNYQMAAAAPEALSTQLVAPSTMAYAPPTSLDAQIAARNKAMVDVYQGAASDFNNLPFMDKVGQSTKALMSPETGGLGAFTREMGGTIPTLKAAGMAAAPMLLAPPEMGGDDGSADDEAEMAKRRYKYAAQYTGGLRMPGAAYTSERQYFTEPTFTKLAEGGEVEPDVAKGMTGQSADAMRYLMGKTPSTQAFAPPAPEAPPAGTIVAMPDKPGGYALVATGDGGYGYASPSAVGPGYGFSDAVQAGLNTSLGAGLAWGASQLGLLGDMYSDTQAPVTDMSSYSAESGGAGGWGGGDVSGGYGGVDSGGYSGDGAGGYYKKGGIVDLKKGGFVVPADVVSALGNGSSEAGLEMLSKRFGAKPIKGKGDGQSDSIPAKIDRKQPAAVARDEAYLNPAQVKKAGGAKKLYAMMDKIRTQAHGKKEQQRPVNPRAALA